MMEEPRLFVKTEQVSRENEEATLKPFRSLAVIVGHPREGQEVAIADAAGRVALNDYLPKGVSFVAREGGAFEYYAGQHKHSPEDITETERVEFPPERLNTLGGRLYLLHEMGHSIGVRAGHTLPRHEKELVDVADKIIDTVRRSEQYRSLGSDDDREKHYVKEFTRLWEEKRMDRGRSGPPNLRYDELSVAIRGLARLERDSWAEALRLRKRIQSERGVDVLEGAKTRDVFDHIKKVALESYERTYAPLLKLAGERPDSPRDWIDRFLDHLYRLAR